MNLPLRPTLLAAFGLAFALPAAAQQTPLTGQMMDGRTPVAAPAPQQVAPPDTATGAPGTYAPPPLADVGDDGGVGSTTRQLLRLQVSGSQAGQPLPMLGDEATAAYRRYMQSFNHPIPEFFQSTVNKNGSGGGNSGGL